MAENINTTGALGVSALLKLAAKVDARLDALESAKSQANVLEGVKVNGVALAIADKMVDLLIASGTENGTLSVAGVDVAVKGLAALAYKAQVSQSDLDAALAAVIAGKAEAADVTALTGRVDTLTGDGEGSITKQIDAALNKFATDVTDDGVVNSYKELIDWVAEHGGDAANMAAAITALEAITAGIGGEDDEYKTISAAIEGAVAEISAGATKTEASETNGNIKIDGVETPVYRHPNDKSAQAIALRKVGSDTEGHVLGGEVVVKNDITTLVGAVGEEEGDLGMMTAADKNKLGGIAAGATKVQGNAATTNGTILVNGTETTVVRFATDEEVEAALNEVFGDTAE